MMRAVRRIDIKIGFACNNRCDFCVQGDKRKKFKPRPFDQIEADLREGREQGALGVVITGGEPTLHPTLLPTARLARDLGYEVLQVQTNGRRFAYRDFCLQLIDAGVTEFAPSLHGPTAKIHNDLTRAPGSFEQTVAGIRNLKKLGQQVILNSVITSTNYEHLPALARLFVDLGVDQFQFAFVHIVGSAEDNSAWLVPRKSDVMPYVYEGLSIGQAAGIPCFTEAIPFCLMSNFESCVAEQLIPKTRIYDAEITIEDYTVERRDRGKAKHDRCRLCRYDDVCEGPWREYPELFGWDEMVPVP